MYRFGIDIGSKTIKAALLDEEGKLVYSNYIRHYSKVQDRLRFLVHNCIWKTGDHEVRVTVTGSAGLRVAELFDIPFVQEVVALKRAVEEYVPQADVILEMGGEDTKLVYLTGVPEQRMNTICAGGTGGFIDTMAGLMGKRSEDMQRLASGGQPIYPIASRCAVFAKSDVRPLINAGARNEDIAASVLDAVCTQAVAGLSAGRPISGTVVLLGGPFNYTPALRDAFCRVTGIDRDHAILPSRAHLFVVRGAALGNEASEPIMLSELERQVQDAAFLNEEGIERLPQLFASKEEYDEFRYRHARCHIPRVSLLDATENLFLGIDAGSTTMKMALIDETGALAAYEYAWNEGDATVSFTWMLESMYSQMRGVRPLRREIVRSCIVGYGEEFCKAAYGVDDGEVETVAHLRAATAVDPNVDFVMDIGGQDIKCFYVHDGMIDDIVLNEACSSGCGSLFDDIARSLRMTKEKFCDIAKFAESPVDLGTRCSVFMDSRVKHAQKEGVSHGDIAAGIAYSTARNALFKVVRQPDFSKVGKNIVVQGGAFANDALLRAFERETGVEVKRPDLSQLMGAWGAALLARDKWAADLERDEESTRARKSTLISSEALSSMEVRKTTARCDQCTNACKLMVTRFVEGDDERVFVTGNRCERGLAAFDVRSEGSKRPPNVMAAKSALIAKCDRARQPQDGVRVGIPRVLALYESYPFWKRFFNELGCTVVPASTSSEQIYRKGMGLIPAESACYPSKLVYGHVADLVERGAELVFLPRMGLSFAREGLLGLPFSHEQRECPLIERAADMVLANEADLFGDGVRFVGPDFTHCSLPTDIADELAEMLAAAGVPCDVQDVLDALRVARDAYRSFFEQLSELNARVLARIDAGEFPGALVMGHPYHSDPGISHGIDELLGKLGYAVIERVDYDFWRKKPPVFGAAEWSSNAELSRAIADSRSHDNLQLIIPRSFGCGIDALMADAAHDAIRESGRVYAELKLDQIVDLAAVRIRLRSLAYAVRQRRESIKLREVNMEDFDLAAVERAQERTRQKKARDVARGLARTAQAQEVVRAGFARTGDGIVSPAQGVTFSRAPLPAGTVLTVPREHARYGFGPAMQEAIASFGGDGPQSVGAGSASVRKEEFAHAHVSNAELIDAMHERGYELFFDGGDDQQNQFMACTFLCKIMFIGADGEMKNFYNWGQVERFLKEIACK